jgi:hypothetical protein
VSALARIDVDSVVRAATSVNGSVATRDAIGIRTQPATFAAALVRPDDTAPNTATWNMTT